MQLTGWMIDEGLEDVTEMTELQDFETRGKTSES